MRRTRWSLPLRIPFLAVTFVFAGLPGCGQQGPQVGAPAKPVSGARATPSEVARAPIGEKDCLEYANEVVAAVATGNKSVLNALIDWDAIFATSTADLDAPATVVSGWIREMKQSLATGLGFADAIIQNSKAGGQFDYLRTRISHGQQVILFRLIGGGTQGVNYIEFIVKQGPDRKVRAADIYPYVSGEFMTESIRRGLLPAAASASRSFLAKLVTKEQDVVLDMPKIQPIADAIIHGKKKEAMRLLDELRPETRKTKMVLLLRTQAAQEAGEKEYLATLEEFRSLFPNDPSLDLQLIDYYLLTKKPEEALKCIDRLDRSVGGDPYLNYMRASLALERGDRAEARRLGELVVKEEPSFKQAYFFLLGISIQDKTHVETLTQLKRLQKKLGVTFKDLTTVKEYGDFVKSPQYKEWVTYLDQEEAANAKSKPQQGQQPKPAQKAPESVKQ